MLIQIYTGEGKGKTTAALGLAVRAAGHGFRVRILQFLKGSTYSGELTALEKLGVEIYQFGRTCPHAAVIKSGLMECQKCDQCWISLKEISAIDRKKVELAWDMARNSTGYQLLILDEIINAINKGLVSLVDVLSWLDTIPDGMEVVLTGRNAPAELVNRAHLVSEVKKVKHPLDKGISSRRGIEY